MEDKKIIINGHEAEDLGLSVKCVIVIMRQIKLNL